MKSSRRCIPWLIATSVATAACSQSSEVTHLQYAPNADSLRNGGAARASYRVLHSFGSHRDGSQPNDLIRIGDTFYGTTKGGGTHYCASYSGCGTFFSLTMDGKERVLHDFGSENDGRNPVPGLTYADGTIYGATNVGGAHGEGTIFSVTLSGKEKVVHSFGPEPDGESPNGDLVYLDGTLYGTTFAGGEGCAVEGCGTVFSLTTDGKERVLHRFQTGLDGWYPAAGLTDVRGTFYGTTWGGGLYGNWGVLFKITRSGRFKILHYFGAGNDGWYPEATLIDIDGTLYGTTEGGGAGNCGRGYGGCGTVFSMTTDGAEPLLYSFRRVDGAFPVAKLINVNGTLYGTTWSGGANYCDRVIGLCGTVFSISTGGDEQVLHSFRKGIDGNDPETALNYTNGSFFGTTEAGGAYNRGVVFALTPLR